MSALATDLRVDANLECLYPMGGKRNILAKRGGPIKKMGYGPNGVYATIQEKDGSYRSLSQNKMINPVVT